MNKIYILCVLRAMRNRLCPSFPSRNHQLSPADGPKVVGKVSVAEVFVGHGKIALQAPIASPGISDNKTLLGIIVAHAENGVPAEHLLLRFGHRHDTVSGNFLGFETLIDGKAEDKREPFGQTGPHLVQGQNTAIGGDLMLQGLLIAGGSRFGFKLGYVVGPDLLGAGPLVGQGLDSIPDHGPRIGVYGVFQDPFVVI